MKSIYLIQMHTYTLPARMLKAVTHYPYSHMCISLDKNCDITYSFGRKKLHNFLISGFVKLHSTDRFFQKFRYTQCRIFELVVSDKQYLALQTLLNEFEANEKQYHYDFCGLFLRGVFQIPVSFRNRYVCSQFVAEVLDRTGIYQFPHSTCMIKPQDFETLHFANEIYRGSYPMRR